MSRWVFLLFAAACASSAAPTTTSSTLPSLRFYDHEDLGITLSPDGLVRVAHYHADGPGPAHKEWTDIARITADGEIRSIDDKLHTRLGTDGTFEGVTPGLKLAGDTIVLPKNNQQITIDVNGEIRGGFQPLRVEGATGPAGRRAALLVVVTPIVFEALGTAAPRAAYGMPGVQPVTGIIECDGFIHRVKTCKGLAPDVKRSVQDRVSVWVDDAGAAPDRVGATCRSEAERLQSALVSAGC